MVNQYYIVSKEVLPEVFTKVIEVKRMMEMGEYTQISDAVRHVGLSRSAYYKYKDHVFEVGTDSMGRKAVISFLLSHEQGRLSEVLQVITSLHGNILTIQQNIPIHAKASVSICMDITELSVAPDQLCAVIGKQEGVSKVQLIAFE